MKSFIMKLAIFNRTKGLGAPVYHGHSLDFRMSMTISQHVVFLEIALSGTSSSGLHAYPAIGKGDSSVWRS
jgi:hypothetical protein